MAEQFEKLTLVVSKKDNKVKAVKNILAAFQNRLKDLKISSPKFGELSDRVVISFEIERSKFDFVVEKLVLNNVQILSHREKTREIINRTKVTIDESSTNKKQGWNDLSTQKKKYSSDELEEHAKKGDIETILNVSRDLILYNKLIVEKANNLLPNAVSIAIDIAYNSGIKNEKKAEDSILKLLLIAGHPTLKTFPKMDMLKLAGNAAIEIAVLHPDHNSMLITICNRTGIHNITNIKSAVELSKIIFSVDPPHEELLAEATKKLNLRWLTIAYDVAQKSLSAEEDQYYNKIVSTIFATKGEQ